MAKKFGGKFSPDGQDDASVREAVVDARKVDAAGAKATILFAPGVLLAFLSLNEGAVGLIMGLLGAAVLTVSAWLTRDGLRAAAAFDQRRVARKPAVPRKFLSVYLEGARDAAAKFADLYKRQRNETARADFEALLDDLEQNFAALTEKMLLDERGYMNIEIKVLRDRLQREGL